jgi:hypothetical protein
MALRTWEGFPYLRGKLAEKNHVHSAKTTNFYYSLPERARFSATVQTGPEDHPTSCTMGTGSYPGVKR